jgi:membrane-associated phospholipid phosphatase
MLVVVVRSGREAASRRAWDRERVVVDEHAWQGTWRLWAIGALALAMSWWFATDDRPEGFEVTVGKAARGLPDGLEPLLRLVMQSGSRWFCILMIAFAAGLARFRLALALLVAGASAWLLSTLIKHLVTAPRPTGEALGEVARITETGYGFPSTHAAISAAVMLTLAAAVRSARIGRSPLGHWLMLLCIAAVATTALARMYLGVHWLLDVVGGAGLGVLCGGAAVRVGRRRRSAVSDQWV